jgi:hypothetical protein
MLPLVHLKYDLDTNKLLEDAKNAKLTSKPYTDTRYPNQQKDDWHIGHYTSDNIQKIMLDFGIEGKPRFYWLEPYATIPEHVDNGTTCSLNFILSKDPAPITIEGVDYTYKQVLLDTTRMHSVTNGNTERVMLKISIFDKSFKEVASLIPNDYKF